MVLSCIVPVSLHAAWEMRLVNPKFEKCLSDCECINTCTILRPHFHQIIEVGKKLHLDMMFGSSPIRIITRLRLLTLNMAGTAMETEGVIALAASWQA